MIEKVSEQNNNVNIKRLDSDYQDLIENIKGKTVDHIVANSEESTSSGFDIVFTDGTVLEIYWERFVGVLTYGNNMVK